MAEETQQPDMAALLEEAAEAVKPAEEPKDPEGSAPAASPAPEKLDEQTSGGSGATPPSFTPDDALIERAVKAGMSVADAKALPNAEMADRILTALEAKAEGATTKKADGEETDDGAGVPAIDISEFTEENGYDPAMVKVLQSMKAVVEGQAKKIASLEKAGASAKAQDFFTTQFNSLDEGVRSHMDASRKSQLKAKFNVLEAGYKASNAKYSPEDVFKEAVQLVAGDLVSKADAEHKAAAAEKRRALALARPGGNIGANRNGAGQVSEVDIANALFDALTK